MLPRTGMVAIKNRMRAVGTFFVAACLLLGGCMPPGPRALLDGKQLVEQGRYPEAIEKLKTATSLLATNAQAWNYLGLAYHHAGQTPDAVLAYQRALQLNHDLTEAHYNLGCLWWEQNKLDAARTEFNFVTLRRPNSAAGWSKLGGVQWRLHDVVNAEKSFNEAARLNPQDSEVLNGLGLIAWQHNRPRDAARFFTNALKARPDYGPALLNLAVISHAYLGDRQLALQKYREYLALKPTPPNADAVSATARALEQQLEPASRPAQTNVIAQVAPRNEPGRPATNVVLAAVQPRTETPAVVSKPAPLPRPVTNVPVVKPTPVSTATVTPAASTVPVFIEQPKPPAKRGFFASLNPFHRKEETAPKITPLPVANNPVAPQTSSVAPPKIVSTPAPVFARYQYRSPSNPNPGNRTAAEVPLSRGNQAYQAGRFAEAAQAYLQAVQLDASYFNAQYYLGLAAGQAGNLGQSLAAYENALAIQPDSADARYVFALALKKANYPVDAALELEKILAGNPGDARAHLAAGNIYAQQLQQPAKAREHYLKVLEYDPNNKQATLIRYWLVDHPI